MRRPGLPRSAVPRSVVPRSAARRSAGAKSGTATSSRPGPGTAAARRTRTTRQASNYALAFVLAVVGVVACAGPTSHGHDDIHAACFELVMGHGTSLSLAALSTDEVANPAPSAPPPAPTRAWSNAAGWPGGAVPAAGEDVIIRQGEVVLLDVSPPTLGSLVIAGDLVFNRQNLDLSVGTIEIRGGMYVGSATQPFEQRAVITVGHEERTQPSRCFGENYIGLVHGTLEVYGSAAGAAWTRLSTSASEGDTTIFVDDASGWQVGDQIAIASTDYYTYGEPEASDPRIEVRTITGWSETALSFDQPLRYPHYGESQTFDAPASFPVTVLESRAEVMRLSRNVTIRGLEATSDEASPVHRFGSHIKALGQSRVRLDSIELTAMGQYFELMRYPVHFHLQGEAAFGSFVRNSSLHHLYNRCITIHGSSGVLLQDNAAYDTFGHCYFFEDGAESRNVLQGNLGMMAREPVEGRRLIPTDGGHMGPSIFWVTNPDNVLEGNVAANSAGSGFWYSLPEHPTGPSFQIFSGENVWLRRTPLGRFKDNLAHSNANDGLHVDRGPAQGTLRAETASYRPRKDPADLESEPVWARFENFVAYKHRGAGAWFRGDHTELTGALLVDNPIGATFASNASGMVNSVVVALSDNVGSADRWENREDGRPVARPGNLNFPLRGFEFYDGAVYVKDSYFEGFAPNGERRAGALSFLDFTSFSLSPLSYAEGLSFAAGTNEVVLTTLELRDRKENWTVNDSAHDGYASGLFIDRDGSVTGTPGRAVTVNNPLLQQPGCSYRADWNAQVCDQRYASLTYRNLGGARIELAPMVLSRGGLDSTVTHTMFGTPNGGTAVPNTHFRALVPLGYEFHYQHQRQAPDAFTVELGSVQAGDGLLVSVPYYGQAPTIYRDWWRDPRNTLEGFASLQDLRDSGDTGYYLDPAGRLYLKLLVNVERERDYAHLTVCRRASCE